MKIRFDRLEQVCAMLAELREPSNDPDRPGFDLTHWRGGGTTCGTTCCVVGHACLRPEFQEQGLVSTIGEAYWQPLYAGCYGWSAVRNFFGITDGAARYLFDRESYGQVNPLPADVLERLQGFLQQYRSLDPVHRGYFEAWEALGPSHKVGWQGERWEVTYGLHLFYAGVLHQTVAFLRKEGYSPQET